MVMIATHVDVGVGSFHANDPVLEVIYDRPGIDYRRNLSDVILANTDVAPDKLPVSVFVIEER